MGLRVIFFSASARFFVAAAKDLSAKQRIVRVQHTARKLCVCYTHTNTRQTCDGMCVPTTDLHSSFKINIFPKVLTLVQLLFLVGVYFIKCGTQIAALLFVQVA